MLKEGKFVPEDETTGQLEQEQMSEYQEILDLHPNILIELMKTGELSRPVLIEEVIRDIPPHADIVKVAEIIYEKSQHPEEFQPSVDFKLHSDQIKLTTFEVRRGFRIPIIYKPKSGEGKGGLSRVKYLSFDGGKSEIMVELIKDHSIERNILTWILYDELFNKTINGVIRYDVKLINCGVL